MRIADFDVWRSGAGGDIVRVKDAGTDLDADIWYDSAATLAAPNPITLVSDAEGNGKFARPVYVFAPYYLVINDINSTGITVPPLTAMAGEDASDVTVKQGAENPAVPLKHIVGRVVYATDYGVIGNDAAVNTATITACIGEAASRGGLAVLPAGTIIFNTLSLPADVILKGQGEGVTILQSQVGDRVATITGNNAGLESLTLDGVSVIPNSTGIYAKAKSDLRFKDIMVKRFASGIHFHGATKPKFGNVSLDGCTTGAKLHGDTDQPGDGNGSAITQLEWRGGKVQFCVTTGIDLTYVDAVAEHCIFDGISFIENAGDVVHLKGARFQQFLNCSWNGSTGNNVKIEDDDDDSKTNNRIRTIRFGNGKMSEGTLSFDGECRDVVFDSIDFRGVTFDMSLPERVVTLKDCVEDADVVITGDSVKIARLTSRQGGSAGITSDAVATEAWAMPLDHGQVAYVEGVVLAKQQNGTNIASYHISASFLRAAAQLGFDGQTADFTLGEIITGETSGATGRLVAQTDSGGSGTLNLIDIRGEFVNNETLSDAQGGEALANGTLVSQNVTIKGSQASIHADVEDVAGWAVALAANGGEVRLMVTGAASQTVEWTCHMDVKTT